MNLHPKKILILTLLLFAVLSAPLYTYALELDYPTIPTPIGPLNLNTVVEQGGFTVAGLVLFIYGAAVWIGGILAFITLVYVGFTFIVSGSGIVGRGKAKRRLKEVLYGLTILLFVGVLLNTINPEILDLEDPLLMFVAPGTDQFTGFTFEHKTEVEGGGGGGETIGNGSTPETYECTWTGTLCVGSSGGCTGKTLAELCNPLTESQCGNNPHSCTSVGLLTPPNLDESNTVNCTNVFGKGAPCETYGLTNAYYLLPTNSSLYSRKVDACSRGRLNLIQAIYTITYQWDLAGGPVLAVRDLNEDSSCSGVDHATHNDGTHADISVGNLTTQQRIDFAKFFVDTGTACGILHINSQMETEVNNYFNQTQSYTPWNSKFVRPVSGHGSHFHIRVKKPDGSCN